jgi:glutaminyl-tRNA synthetase
MSSSESKESVHFIEAVIEKDLAAGKVKDSICTRFPPEPNGYLHIGHAKSINLNFGLAAKYKGKCNLRFDDTNPAKEEQEYVDSIREDVRWLGWDWEDREYFASDYYDQLYKWAIELIHKGLAYVCDLSAEQVREYRGTLTEPGKNSPFRDRTVQENLDLFEKMRSGEFADGACTLRAKIDMSSPNVNMRDPAIYRIKKVNHHRTGDTWCIYPMYDFAHGLSDAIEGVTHSICTLEFEAHRPLYDWFLQALQIPTPPHQYEFARLNLSYTVMSKRKLLQLVKDNHVNGWDDPRMPTISGLRRRGYTPASIREFCKRIGVARTDSMVDIELLHFCIREELNRTAPRAMVVLNPLKVVITNYPEGKCEEFVAENAPDDESQGTHAIPFGREIFIEQDDFMEDAPKKFFRLAPGREVRLKYAYFITCQSVIKDENGTVTELHCTFDPETRSGENPSGRKVKGTLHWVSAKEALDVEVRQYEHLFTRENPSDLKEGEDFLDLINPNSLQVLHAKAEPWLKESKVGMSFQFMRMGYYCTDSDSTEQKFVFNRTVGLKDSWSKIQSKN